MKVLFDNALLNLAVATVAAVFMFVGLLIRKVTAYYGAKTTNTQLQGVLQRLDVAAEKVVSEIAQTMDAELKSGDPDAFKRALNAGINKVKVLTHQMDLDGLEKIAGPSGTVEGIITTYIESWVHRKKLVATAVAGTQGAPQASPIKIDAPPSVVMPLDVPKPVVAQGGK
jgi:hypothetical protein